MYVIEALSAINADTSKTPSQKGFDTMSFKASAVLAKLPRLPTEISIGKYTMQISKAGYRVKGGNVPAVWVTVHLFNDKGVDILLDNDFDYVNPPLLFADTSGDISIERINRLGNQTDPSVIKYRYDPWAVIRNDLVGKMVRFVSSLKERSG